MIINNNPWDNQVGGSHYKDKVIQPLQYTLAVKGFDGFDGACHNHVARYTSRVKGCPVENLKKARHIMDLWIYEAEKVNKPKPEQDGGRFVIDKEVYTQEQLNDAIKNGKMSVNKLREAIGLTRMKGGA